MSERQSKKRRQSAPEAAHQKPKKEPAQIWLNVGIGVVIAGFLVLAGFAMKPSVQNMIDKYNASKPQEVVTIEKYAKEQDKSADDFMNEYGLAGKEGITKDTPIDQAKFSMSIENYAKFTGVSLEDFRTNYGLDESITNDTTYTDAQESMRAGAVAQDMGMDFATLKQQFGLPDTITETSTWGEVISTVELMQQAQQMAQENADASADPNASGEPADASDEPSEAPETTPSAQPAGEGE